jgi:hypothetical protein
MTMGQSWAYNPYETSWKASGELVRIVVDVASRGGNLLLNIGPTPQGIFPPEAVERLQYIGRWLNRAPEAVYGTTYTPLQGLSWGRATRKDNKVYFHVFEWPFDGKLEMDAFPGKARNVALLGGESLPFRQVGRQLEITLPGKAADPDVSVVVVDIDPDEEGWRDYSPPVSTTIAPKKYLQKQAITSALVNSFFNGLIALIAYRARTMIPFIEAAVDVLITVAIIAFLVSWISIGSARNEEIKGNLSKPVKNRLNLKLPKSAVLGAVVITILCVILFGGSLDLLIFLVSPEGFGNWTYILLKTLYTGMTGAMAAALAVQSVIMEVRE